ncbi:CS012 protein, partial [Furnarius figulus]|nr:CS012 protein [Furnarius figulus]
LGASLGGFIGYCVTYGQFKPVPQILSELPHNKRKKLYEAVLGLIRHLDWTDARHLIALVMKNTGLQQKLIGVLSNYLRNSLGAKIEYGK